MQLRSVKLKDTHTVWDLTSIVWVFEDQYDGKTLK